MERYTKKNKFREIIDIIQFLKKYIKKRTKKWTKNVLKN